MKPIQPDLFAPPPPAAFPPDPLSARIIERGLVANEFLLGLNQSITAPTMDLPSRLFQFPVEFVDRERRKDRKSALLLRHPDLASYAFVDEIEKETGERPTWEPLDEFGRDRGATWRYFHALDLLTDEHWRDLIATKNFTDREGVVIGLHYRADYGGLSIANMRAALAEFESAEPTDRSRAYLASDEVSACQMQGGIYPQLGRRDSEQAIWAAIHGLEDGLFKRERGHFLRFTPKFATTFKPKPQANAEAA